MSQYLDYMDDELPTPKNSLMVLLKVLAILFAFIFGVIAIAYAILLMIL
jgi:hypothetical protein